MPSSFEGIDKKSSNENVQTLILQLNQNGKPNETKIYLKENSLHLWDIDQKEMNDYVVPIILDGKITHLVLHRMPNCMKPLLQTTVTHLSLKLKTGVSLNRIETLTFYLRETVYLKSFVYHNANWMGLEEMISLFAALKINRSITDLTFKNKRKSSTFLLNNKSPLIDYLQSKPRLASLDIQHVWHLNSYNDEFEHFVNALSAMDTLRSLVLSGVGGISKSNIQCFMNWLKQKPPLTTLNLSENYLDLSRINAIVEMLRTNNTLIEIKVDGPYAVNLKASELEQIKDEIKELNFLLERNKQLQCTVLLSTLSEVSHVFDVQNRVSNIILEYADLPIYEYAIVTEPAPTTVKEPASKNIHFSFNPYAICIAAIGCGLYLAQRCRRR